MSESLIIKSNIDRFDTWVEAFSEMDIAVVDWREAVDPPSVDYALVWKPKPGWLESFINLKVVFSVGAGVDHLEGGGVLPPGIPVVRMVDPTLTAGMVEYVVYMVLRFHRSMPEFERLQGDRCWREIIPVPAKDRKVCILGLGEIGASCARALAQLGFDVSGWSRSPKEIPGVRCLSGENHMDEAFSTADILVCLLPLTDTTRYILNATNIARMPRGSWLINAARGGHQVEEDILSALDSGQLAGAALDVFQTEPLPEDSPIWSHPKIVVTPHVASMTMPLTSAIHVYDNIRRLREGLPLTHLADMSRGY